MSARDFGVGPVPESVDERLFDFLQQMRRAVIAGTKTGAFTGDFVGNLRGSINGIALTPGDLGATDPTPDLTPPPTPSGVTVGAGIDFVGITTDNPAFTMGHGYDRTIVYGVTRSGSDPQPTFSSAVVVHEFVGAVGSFPTNPATEWHIWLKWRTKDGVESVSPSGGTNGHVATTGQDVTKLMEALTGQITSSQLYSALSARIDLIDAASSTPGSVNARIQSAQTTLESADAAIASSVTTLSSTVASKNKTSRGIAPPSTGVVDGDIWYDSANNNKVYRYSASGSAWIPTDDTRIGENIAAIQTEATTRASVDGYLGAQYTLRTQVSANGATVVGGFGVSATSEAGATPTVDFGVAASKFYVAPPYGTANLPSIIPFIVQTTPTTLNGAPIPAGVYMDSAYIRDLTAVVARMGSAWITNAMVASLSASKLTAGTIAVGEYIQSSDYVPNTLGWRLSGNTAELPFTNIRGQLQAGQVSTGFVSTTMLAAKAATIDKIDARGLTLQDANGNDVFTVNTPFGTNTSDQLGYNTGWSNWTGTYPAGWSGLSAAAPTRDAGTTFGSPFTARWVTAGAADIGMRRSYTFTQPRPAGTYIEGTFAMRTVTYVSGGSPGYLVRLFTNAGLTTFVDTWFPITAKAAADWQVMSFTAGANQAAIYGIDIFQLASYSGAPDGGILAAGSDVMFGPMSFSIKDPITASTASTKIANAAIGWAQIGDLTISTGGGIRSGKTTYASGTGWLLEYNGGTPRLDIGTTDAYLRWTGTTLDVKVKDGNLLFDAFNLTISGGDAAITMPTNTVSRSVTVAGGKGPYRYFWLFDGHYGRIYTGQGTGTVTVMFHDLGDGKTYTNSVVCLVRDSNGRASYNSFDVTVTMGTTPVSGAGDAGGGSGDGG